MRKILVSMSLLLSLSAQYALATDTSPPKQVNLNVPGIMMTLRESRPTHFEKIQAIVRDLRNHDDQDVPRWMQTNFNAKNVLYSRILLTTSPAQRDLSFVLDDTRYRGRVTLERGGAQIFPIKSQ